MNANTADAPASTPERLSAFARFLLASRRHRNGIFPNVEFGEPAWDMLLDLYVQHVEKRRVCITSLCTAAAVPATTALRWIDMMVREEVFIRQTDPADGRCVHARLNAGVVEALEAYLSDMRDRAGELSSERAARPSAVIVPPGHGASFKILPMKHAVAPARSTPSRRQP